MSTATVDTSDITDDLLDHVPDHSAIHVTGEDPFDVTELAQQDGILFFDFETVPDESRFPRLELVIVEGSSVDLAEEIKKNAPEIKELVGSLSDEQLDQLTALEASNKSRKGVFDAITSEQKSRTDGFAKWLKSCSTSPLKGRIVAAGFAIGEGEPHSIIATNDDEERALLAAFWQLLERERVRCGYNILAFDDEFAGFRSVILGVQPSKQLNRKKYNNREAIDLQQRLFPSGLSQAESCKTVAFALGIDIPAGRDRDGSHVWPLWEAEMYDEIAEYVRSDVYVEQQIYYRIGGVFTDQ